MNKKATRVKAAMFDCMYQDDPQTAPADAVMVDGITMKFGFDPKRVEANRTLIGNLIDEIVPEAFYEGMSFLNLCEAKDGEHWGEHQNMQELYVIAAAIGRARFLLPKDLWGSLPGGMPYIMFKRE